MVGVAQLVEHLVVVQDVAGSSPVTHPDGDVMSRVRTSSRTRGARRQTWSPRKPPPGCHEGVEDTMVQIQRLSAAEAVNMVAELASELIDTPSLEELLERA